MRAAKLPVTHPCTANTAAATTTVGPQTIGLGIDGKLDVGETWHYTASQTLTQAEIELPEPAALGAEFVLHGPRGARTIQASEFFLGLMTTALAPDEILVEIHVPPQGPGWGFAEVVRRAGDFALAGVVALVGRPPGSSGHCGSARLVGFGVGDRPVRFAAAEEILTGPDGDPSAAVARAASAAAEACDPPEDVHASADYRRHLASVLIEDTVRQALTRLDGARPA